MAHFATETSDVRTFVSPKARQKNGSTFNSTEWRYFLKRERDGEKIKIFLAKYANFFSKQFCDYDSKRGPILRRNLKFRKKVGGAFQILIIIRLEESFFVCQKKFLEENCKK